jgi:carbonic anhydrase
VQNLLPGLRKFSEKVFPNHQKLFESLSQGQTPHTLLITCSDSRIDPNLVTQTQPGEIFVVRNAGNIVPPYGSSRGGEEAAIEFAIEGLGVRNIVICGHSKCGAMAALCSDQSIDHLPSVKEWLRHAHATKRRVDAMPESERDLTKIVEENVLVQADNIKSHPAVSAALRARKVNIFGWVYNFEHGAITVFDPVNKRFIPSTEVKEETEKNVTRFAI